MIILGQPEVYLVYKNELINEVYEITNADTAKFLQGFLDIFSRWITSHH